jgi:hypothetical protein
MTSLSEALIVLGLVPGQSLDEARQRFRELLLKTHPDVVGNRASAAEATDDTIALTTSFDVVKKAVARGDGHLIPAPTDGESQAPTNSGNDTGRDACRHRSGNAPPPDTIEIRADGDSLFISAPPPEAFAILLDASSRLGGIGYVDRNLGILEVIVRFEGGPSCSVLMTLQGRAFGTDVFITMESIEADPTPALDPVMEALFEELANLSAL